MLRSRMATDFSERPVVDLNTSITGVNQMSSRMVGDPLAWSGRTRAERFIAKLCTADRLPISTSVPDGGA
ncbi:MAG TPA: hypothetical protein VM053_12555 [Gemmatimonadaceae bacterium]|nr:hypothetical protein [Gemmatimonadaceae bacterium]